MTLMMASYTPLPPPPMAGSGARPTPFSPGRTLLMKCMLMSTCDIPMTRNNDVRPGQHSQGDGTIVWGDDQTMGTVLVARMATQFKNHA